MGGENQDGEPSEHTVVVNIKIKPDCEKNYDEWLRRFLVSVRKKVPGYLGTTTIMETSKDSTVRHIIHRFRDMVYYTRLEGKCSSPSQMENGNSCVHWSIFHKLSRAIRPQPFTRTADVAS